MKVGDIVKHKSGVEFIVLKTNPIVSTCEYLHEKDYIRSKFMAMESVTKIAIVLNENIVSINESQLKSSLLNIKNMKELELFIINQRKNYPDVPNFNEAELHFIERFAQYYYDLKVESNNISSSINNKYIKVVYCKNYVNNNGLCLRCGLDRIEHSKMIEQCEKYNKQTT